MTLLNDIRHAIRSLGKSRSYALACIMILAVGIGANTAIFTLIDSIILKGLPYPESGQLAFLWLKVPSIPEPFASRMTASKALLDAWRRAPSITNAGAFIRGTSVETGVDRPRHVENAAVSNDFLPMLGAQVTLGRLFLPEEQQAGRDEVVILEDSYYTRRFNRDPHVIGKTIGLDGVSYTVVGVISSAFRMPAIYGGGNRSRRDVFIPLSRRVSPEAQHEPMLYVAGRLKAGATIAQANSELSGIVQQVKAENKDAYAPEVGVHVSPFSVEDEKEGLDRQLYLVWGAVGFFLLLACANLANLTLARTTGRIREIAVRTALGATRKRILAQLLTESLVVSVLGAGVGLIVANGLVSALMLVAPDGLDRPEDIHFRWPVFAFAAAVTVLTTILFGLFPALRASRTDVHTALKAGGRTSTGPGFRSRQLLTAAEVAFSLMLIVGAGLLVRTVMNLVDTGVGFDIERLAVVHVDLPESRYADAGSRERFLADLATQARRIPGVQKAAVSTTLPLNTVYFTTFKIEGHPKLDPRAVADSAHISPEYLDVVGIPVVAGRTFNAEDAARNRGKGDGVAMINQTFAEKFLPGENPIGRRLVLDADRRFEIVGVTANYRALGPLEPERPQYYLAGVRESVAILVLKTVVKPESLTKEIQQTVWSLDKQLPVVEVGSMRNSFYVDGIGEQIFSLIVLGVFAGLGLLLAMTGVYSILAYLVASRRREIGIRMAVGASAAAIARMVAEQSVMPVGLGVLGGLLGSLALSRLLESMLFNVSSQDPVTYSLAVLAVLVAVPIAIWVPMRRAMRVECSAAIREE